MKAWTFIVIDTEVTRTTVYHVKKFNLFTIFYNLVDEKCELLYIFLMNRLTKDRGDLMKKKLKKIKVLNL